MFDDPVVSVHLPPDLRNYAGGHEEIIASGDTVGELLVALGHTYPALRGHLLSSSGELVSGLAVYLGARSIRDSQGLNTPVQLEETLSIISTGNH
ncbi:MAG: molybdopterin synthase sulfur carrier subunit [Rhodocyclales bacterium GT-UBC]|nr:MAG: molybdopterin synthase sulfur carrier subunit [Rhodocyclales bacterium GT-UBC]